MSLRGGDNRSVAAEREAAGASEITEHWRDVLVEEIRNGGKQPPCPFCGVPRVQRSDYIRCCRCGINWMAGEALDKDPRNVRSQKLIEDSKGFAAKQQPRREEYGRR